MNQRIAIASLMKTCENVFLLILCNSDKETATLRKIMILLVDAILPHRSSNEFIFILIGIYLTWYHFERFLKP